MFRSGSEKERGLHRVCQKRLWGEAETACKYLECLSIRVSDGILGVVLSSRS
jgi:hypothetical protein